VDCEAPQRNVWAGASGDLPVLNSYWINQDGVYTMRLSFKLLTIIIKLSALFSSFVIYLISVSVRAVDPPRSQD